MAAYVRGVIMVLKIITAWIAIGFLSYGAMWACASEAQCMGGCDSYECRSMFDCGISCNCIKVNDSLEGVCVEVW